MKAGVKIVWNMLLEAWATNTMNVGYSNITPSPSTTLTINACSRNGFFACDPDLRLECSFSDSFVIFQG
jgi:hypothetical protein